MRKFIDIVSEAANADFTPEFRQWFGTSRILDDESQPGIVHHFTYFDFEQFDRLWGATYFGRDPEAIDTLGIWFTDNPEARYVSPLMGGKRKDAYLRVEHPFYIDDMEEGDGFIQLRDMVDQAGGTTNLRKHLKSQGYDGVVLSGTKLDNVYQNAIIVFDNDQIRVVQTVDLTEGTLPQIVYHGTNQTFDEFSPARLAMATGEGSGAEHGYFFTDNKDEAWDYAEGAGRKVVSNVDHFEATSERLRTRSERLESIARRTGRNEDWEAANRAAEEWENHEIAGTREDHDTNLQVIAAKLSMDNPLDADFNGTIRSEHGLIQDTIDAALVGGHDGVILRNINDSPKGGFHSTQYVVFSASQIRIVGRETR